MWGKLPNHPVDGARPAAGPAHPRMARTLAMERESIRRRRRSVRASSALRAAEHAARWLAEAFEVAATAPIVAAVFVEAMGEDARLLLEAALDDHQLRNRPPTPTAEPSTPVRIAPASP